MLVPLSIIPHHTLNNNSPKMSNRGYDVVVDVDAEVFSISLLSLTL